MTIDVFVLQIMISGEIQAVNIGNTRLVPGFPQGSNSLEKASALGALTLIGTGGPSVCWIDHKTTPFDNLYRGMEKESRKSHPKGREIVEQK